MRIITFPVDDSIADSYYNSAPQEKTKINSTVNLILRKILKDNKNAALFEAIDQLSGEASQNGLSIEKLGELMEWDEETIKNIWGENILHSDYFNLRLI